MRRVLLVAGREFMAAVANKGFVIGLLLMPAVFALIVALMPRLMNTPGEQVRGEVAVIDPTGLIVGELRTVLTPAAIARRRTDVARRALENAPAPVRDAADGSNPVVQRAIGSAPDLQILERPSGADIQREKNWLTEPAGDRRHVAVVVVHRDAVMPASEESQYGAYDLYVPENLDERIEFTIHDGLREAIVSARLAAHKLDRQQVEAVMRVARPRSVTVAAGAERQTNIGFNRALPWVFAGLLVFGVMIGGQTLLTQTVEEKSSRVIEVLLSAVSPLELMAGKILGQMAVSLLVLAIYIGLGLLMLTSFAMLGLLDPMLIVYLVVFFLIAYLVFASVFGAIGAAVNEMREAQSLMTPVMLALMAPWIFGPAIARDPNSTFSMALSFIPPVNTFAMMVRLSSTTPPPVWQVGLTIVIGLASAFAAMWFAAKVFKVGLLMHGKAPNFATLIRWARAA